MILLLFYFFHSRKRTALFRWEVPDNSGGRSEWPGWWPLWFCCSPGVGFPFSFSRCGTSSTQTFPWSQLYWNLKSSLTRCLTLTLVLTRSCTHSWTRVFERLSRRSFQRRVNIVSVCLNRSRQTPRPVPWSTRRWWRHAQAWTVWRPPTAPCDVIGRLL